MIRRAKSDDSRAIAQMHVDSWKTAYAGILPQEILARLSYEEREQRWHDILSDPTERQFVFVADASDSGRIIGFACAGEEQGGNAVYRGEISALYLLRDYQRLGIGRCLVSAAAAELLRRGIRTMLIRVLAASPSRHFYEVLGGRKLSEGEAHIGGGAYPDVTYGWENIQSLAGQKRGPQHRE